MIRILLKAFAFAIALLISVAVKNFLELLWVTLTGLSSNGLSSLASLILITFSFTLILPLRKNSRRKINTFFKKVLVIVSIWLASSFMAALLHQSKHVPLGLIPALFYASTLIPHTGAGLRIVLNALPEDLDGYTLLMCVAPTPKIFLIQGLGLRSIVKVLRGRAKIVKNVPAEKFIKSFKNLSKMELQGSLASFVERIAENWSREAAVVCEAKPRGGSFRLRVKIASDDPKIIQEIRERVSKLDDGENLSWALEKWMSLKPCVKPIQVFPASVSLRPDQVPQRLFIAGDPEGVEDLALRICSSQLRINSRILIVGEDNDAVFRHRVEERLAASGFRRCRKPKTYTARGGVEVILANKADLESSLVEKIYSKPLIAVWFRNSFQGPEPDAPLKVLTVDAPNATPALEVDGILLLKPDKRLLEGFLPARHGLALEGRTVMVSAKEVRVLG